MIIQKIRTLMVSIGFLATWPALASTGILGEHAFDPLNIRVVGVPLKLNPGQGWVLAGTPGADFHRGHQEALIPLGIGCEFKVEGDPSLPETRVPDWVDPELGGGHRGRLHRRTIGYCGFLDPGREGEFWFDVGSTILNARMS